MTIKFELSDEDRALVEKVADRACAIEAWMKRGLDRVDLEMSLAAVHINDMKLDFQHLIDAEQYDFTHDILGILQHINRDTGKLEDFFCPRCAHQEEAANDAP